MDIKQLHTKKARIESAIESLKQGLSDQRDKLKEWEKLVTLAEAGINENGYDVDALKDGLVDIQFNIDNIESVLKAEEDKLAIATTDFKGHAEILRQHGICVAMAATGDHDWEITEKFQSGNIKRRRCRDCPTEDRVGHG